MKGYIKKAAVTAAALLISTAALSRTAVMAAPPTDSSSGTGTSTDIGTGTDTGTGTDIGTGTGTEIAPETPETPVKTELKVYVDNTGDVEVVYGTDILSPEQYTVTYDLISRYDVRTGFSKPVYPGTYNVNVTIAGETYPATKSNVLINDVAIDVSQLSDITIYQDMYTFRHDANDEEIFVPYTGEYTFTGVKDANIVNNPIRFVNYSVEPVTYEVNFDNLKLVSSQNCSGISFERSLYPMTVNIKCKGVNTVNGGNTAAFINRSDLLVTLNIDTETNNGASFSFGRKDGISTETLYQQNNTSSEVECTLNGTSVGPQGTKFTSIDLPDGYTGNYTYSETSEYANNYTFDPDKVIPEFKATIINPANKYFTLLTEDKKAVGATSREPESGYIAESAHIAGIKPAKLEKGQIIKVDDTVSTYRSEFYIQEFPESTKINAFGMNTTREDYVDYSDYEFDLKCGTAQVRDTIYNDYTMGSGGASIITAKKTANAEGIGIFVADGNGSYADPYEFDELLRYSPTQDAPVWSDDLHEGDEFVIYGAEGKTVSVSDKTDVIVLESDTEFDVVFDNGNTERAELKDGKYTLNCPDDRYITSVKKANSYLVVFGSIVKATVGDKEYSKIFTLSESKDVTFTSERFFRVKMGNTVKPAEKSGDVYTLTVNVNDNVNVYDASFYIGQQFFAEDGAEYVVYQGEKYYYNYVDTAQPFDFYGSVSQSEIDEKVFQIAKVKFVADDSRYNFKPIKPEENNSNKVVFITKRDYKNGIGVYLESGNGTASAPYDFKELFEYKIVNGTADSYVTIADLHAGDRITDGNITAEVRQVEKDRVVLWCDNAFYISTTGTGYVYHPVNYGIATVTFTGFDSNTQITGFSAYDQSVENSNGCVNLSLNDGTIGFNLYYRVAAADADGAYIKPSGTKIPLYTLDTTTLNDTNFYVCRITVPAKNIADEFDPNVYKADGTRLNLGFGEGNISAYSVAKAYYDNAAEYDKDKSAQLKELAKALLNYCEYAQRQFGITPVISGDWQYVHYYNDPFDSKNEWNVSDLDTAVVGGTYSKNYPDGVKFAFGSLTLETKTELNLYFTNTTGKELSFSLIDGEGKGTLEAPVQNGSYTQVKITGIAPEDLATPFKLKITLEGDESGDYFVQYGPMRYIYKQYQKYKPADEETENDVMFRLMKALYKYYQAAVEYKG